MTNGRSSIRCEQALTRISRIAPMSVRRKRLRSAERRCAVDWPRQRRRSIARKRLSRGAWRRDVLEAQGRITFLRVHDLGTGFGPPNDFLDVECVVLLDTQPNKYFGFQLRNDRNRPAREGMLLLLREAFATNQPVTIDFFRVAGKNGGTIFRVALIRAPTA